MKKIVVITGASSGMGRAAVNLFASRGWEVFGGARHVERIPSGEKIHALKLDLTDSESIKHFVNDVLKKQEYISVLINAAGYGEYGAVEEVSIENVKRQFSTNFFGVVELTQLILPIMRKQNLGRIVNVSSAMGDSFLPTGGYYSAVKSALQKWSDTLNAEVSHFGINVVVVQPGATKSGFGESLKRSIENNSKENSPYNKMIANVEKMSMNYNFNATSEDLAEVFYKASTDIHPNMRYYNTLMDHLTVYFTRNHPQIMKLVVNRMAENFYK
ncbi:SDR family oxidoreductase [Companilactobacillus keshanensis]|uniref:SDR family oxidoreductase n=1 Tax=Companilactobacillus keshanensis TaxID=2486003 RepID=A0ABW4BQI5_9LACO|nr:SDR family oxidoreductase [Companilactobacillus keshanensis]